MSPHGCRCDATTVLWLCAWRTILETSRLAMDPKPKVDSAVRHGIVASTLGKSCLFVRHTTTMSCETLGLTGKTRAEPISDLRQGPQVQQSREPRFTGPSSPHLERFFKQRSASSLELLRTLKAQRQQRCMNSLLRITSNNSV